ncbi:hypothetical protein BC830DRAFT_203370 [Chytriomyces sp. MP71]|nr:hypothetical protein BC830DRAFT_203370 [Chytriomyces sp. MP71]
MDGLALIFFFFHALRPPIDQNIDRITANKAYLPDPLGNRPIWTLTLCIQPVEHLANQAFLQRLHLHLQSYLVQ